LNARSAVQKAALIEDVINDNRLDALAVCESWIRDDAPAAIKNDIAPSNYSVLHVHRSQKSTNDRLKMGGGLAFIHRDDTAARPIKVTLTPTTYELQLVGLQLNKVLVKVANIYRPPSSSKSMFLDEFAELLTTIGSGIGERRIICGDFNMPGADEATIDDQLATLLDVHGYEQHVTGPTRGNNLLDLVITTTQTQQSCQTSSSLARMDCPTMISSSANCRRDGTSPLPPTTSTATSTTSIRRFSSSGCDCLSCSLNRPTHLMTTSLSWNRRRQPF